VSPVWGDLIARARGLGTHLLTTPQLAALARAPDLAALADGLRRHGYPMGEETRSPADLEVAVRRVAGAQLGVLGRWAGRRGETLAVLFEDEDRRSLRALLRGAVAGAPAEERVAGLLPTGALPAPALAELAHQTTPAAVAAVLTAWGNPYGSALLPEAGAAQPDLLKLEVRVNRTFAARALRAARHAGHRSPLVEHVRETIDLENAATALVLAAGDRDVIPKDLFLAGGRRVTIAAFEQAIGAGEGPAAAHRLAAAFAGTLIAGALEGSGADPAGLERALLRARIVMRRRAARDAPLGPAPVLLYALRLRAQLLDLQRIIWGVALGAPAVAASLVSA